jgi:hypothetical protein
MSFYDEVIDFISFTIAMMSGLVIIYFLIPYLLEYTGHFYIDLTTILVFNAVAIFCLGCYILMRKVLKRII